MHRSVAKDRPCISLICHRESGMLQGLKIGGGQVVTWGKNLGGRGSSSKGGAKNRLQHACL